MSDLHGCYDEFIKMLELIQFNDKDSLYILGDIFDRGNNPLAILDYIVTHKNIHLIKGNHEEMFLDYYENGDMQLWFHNGGESTFNQILSKDYAYEVSIYRYIKKLPVIKIVDKFIFGSRRIIFPDNYENMELEEFIKKQDDDICLWSRDNIGDEKSYKDYTIIVGHTPVQSITNNCDDVKILKRNGTIYIDCGCVFKKANGKLACIRLNDMKEFYV